MIPMCLGTAEDCFIFQRSVSDVGIFDDAHGCSDRFCNYAAHDFLTLARVRLMSSRAYSEFGWVRGCGDEEEEIGFRVGESLATKRWRRNRKVDGLEQCRELVIFMFFDVR